MKTINDLKGGEIFVAWDAVGKPIRGVFAKLAAGGAAVWVYPNPGGYCQFSAATPVEIVSRGEGGWSFPSGWQHLIPSRAIKFKPNTETLAETFDTEKERYYTLKRENSGDFLVEERDGDGGIVETHVTERDNWALWNVLDDLVEDAYGR